MVAHMSEGNGAGGGGLQVSSVERLGDPWFTRWQCTLTFPAAALCPLGSDLCDLICCCQFPLICEQAGMSLGERAGR